MLREDLSNPLLTDNEIDRFVEVGTAEGRELSRSGNVVFQGSVLNVFEVDGELVGTLDREAYSGEVIISGLSLVVLVPLIWGLVTTRQLRSGRRKRPIRHGGPS